MSIRNANACRIAPNIFLIPPRKRYHQCTVTTFLKAAHPLIICGSSHTRPISVATGTTTAAAGTITVMSRNRVFSTTIADGTETEPPQHREPFEFRQVAGSPEPETSELWSKLASLRKRIPESTKEDVDSVWKLYQHVYRKKSELQWLRPTNINTLFKLLEQHSDVGEIQKLRLELQSRNIKLSLIDYHVIMRAYVRSGMMPKARKVLGEIMAQGLVPTQHTYHLLIKGYTKGYKNPKTDMEMAEKLVEEMQSKLGCEPNSQTFIRMLLGYMDPQRGILNHRRARYYFAKLMNLEETPDLQRAVGRVWELFDTMVRWRHYETAIFMFETASKKGMKFDVSGWNSIIRAFAESGDMDKAKAFLERMKREGELSPNIETFRILIKGDLGQLGSFSNFIKSINSPPPPPTPNGLKAGIQTFKALITANLEPDTDIYTSFVEAFMQSDPTPENIAILDRLYTAMVSNPAEPPSLATLTRLVRFQIARGALEVAELPYNDARRFGLPLDLEMAREVRHLIIQLAKEHKMLSATALVYDMLSAGVKPNSMVTCSLIKGHAYYKDMEGARQLLEVLREHGVRANEWVYGTMILHYTRLDNPHSARELYEEGIANEVSDNPGLRVQWGNTVLNGYFKRGDGIAATRFLEQMVGRDKLKPNVTTFNTLLDGYMALGMREEADRTKRVMEDCGVRPNMRTNSILILGRIRQQDVEGALQVFDTMRNKGNSLPTGALTALILALFGAGNVPGAERVWGLLKKKRLMSAKAYQAMLVGYGLVGAYNEVRAVYNGMGRFRFDLEEGMKPIIEEWVRRGEEQAEVPDD